MSLGVVPLVLAQTSLLFVVLVDTVVADEVVVGVGVVVGGTRDVGVQATHGFSTGARILTPLNPSRDPSS